MGIEYPYNTISITFFTHALSITRKNISAISFCFEVFVNASCYKNCNRKSAKCGTMFDNSMCNYKENYSNFIPLNPTKKNKTVNPIRAAASFNKVPV